jgi:uncharacterized membrane protein YfcA
MVSSRVRWPLGVAVGFLALVGVAASATHYLQEPYNPGFLMYPSSVYLALAPFQFVKRIRSNHLRYHRWAGRLLVLVGVTALFMGLVIPFSGRSRRRSSCMSRWRSSGSA